MARERLGAVGKVKRVVVDWNDIMKRNLVNDQVVRTDRSQWLAPDGNIYSSKKHPEEHFGGVTQMIMDETKTDHPYRSDLGKYIGDLDYLGGDNPKYPQRTTPIPKRGKQGSGDYSTLDRFMKESGALRIVGTSDAGHLSIEGNNKLSNSQVKFLKQHNKATDLTPEEGLFRHFEDHSPNQIALEQLGYRKNRYGTLRQRIAGLGFRERILNWLKEQPRFKSFDPDSSFVGTVKYDQDNQSMQIELNGKKYDFCNVEERLFDSFSGAGSKGAFFNREIKSLHNCGAW